MTVNVEAERAVLRAVLREGDPDAIEASLADVTPEMLRDAPDLVEAAVAHCEPGKLRALVDAGLDLDFRDGFGRSFLQRRLDRFMRPGEAHGVLRTVEALEELGADLVTADRDGLTPADLLERSIAHVRSGNPSRAAEELPLLERALDVLQRAPADRSGLNP